MEKDILNEINKEHVLENAQEDIEGLNPEEYVNNIKEIEDMMSYFKINIKKHDRH
jgi:hypothetical protein